MRYTLLEMVQRILAAMDSDEVNSISDTTESNQVALLIEGVYNDLVAEANLPNVGTIFQLNASGDNDKPTLMTIPDDILSLEWVKYDNLETSEDIDTPNYQLVEYKNIRDFLDLTNNYRWQDDDIVGTFEHEIDNGDNTDTITFFYLNDRFPTYYTTIDDGTLIFDSYNSDEDTTLQKSKTQCWGAVTPEFSQSDDFTPHLNALQFALLMNEAKARAFVELKQANNVNAEGHARRLRVRLRNSKRRAPYDSRWPLSSLPNYGRK